jgi:hypothetical protein
MKLITTRLIHHLTKYELRDEETRRRTQWTYHPTSPIVACTNNIVMDVVGL